MPNVGYGIGFELIVLMGLSSNDKCRLDLMSSILLASIENLLWKLMAASIPRQQEIIFAMNGLKQKAFTFFDSGIMMF